MLHLQLSFQSSSSFVCNELNYFFSASFHLLQCTLFINIFAPLIAHESPSKIVIFARAVVINCCVLPACIFYRAFQLRRTTKQAFFS